MCQVGLRMVSVVLSKFVIFMHKDTNIKTLQMLNSQIPDIEQLFMQISYIICFQGVQELIAHSFALCEPYDRTVH